MTATRPDSTRDRHLGARVGRIPPPLYYGVTFAVGIVLSRLTVPLDVGGRPATAVVGVVILAAGVGLAVAGVAAVIRRRTTIVPHRAVTTLVTTGAYRLSRNPMYAGLAVAYVGGALLAGTWWPVGLLPVALLVMRRLVIDPEEQYLKARFAGPYAEYARRTRRWL